MRFVVEDALWVRPVDVGASLSGRTYAENGAVVFEVADDFCAWNQDRWRLADGAAEKIDAAADLSVGVQTLGSVLLGGVTFAQLLRAGRVEELREGAVQRADAMFRADRLPWCPEIF
jgi:predicted acetyltransferase